jgi:nucleoid DNA-binding protein
LAPLRELITIEWKNMQRYSYNTNFEVINKNKVKYITKLFINQIIKELESGHLITVVVKIGLYEIDFK